MKYLQGEKVMSKQFSGHFNRTAGTKVWNTAEVWNHVHPTQGNYAGTYLPKSFNVDTPQGAMWTHNNATKHMHETILSIKDSPVLKNRDPKLYTQFILYDYWKSLGKAVKSGIVYNEMIYAGRWEFMFAKPRSKDSNPVIKHAKFTGLK